MGALKRVPVACGMLIGAGLSFAVLLGCTTPPAASGPEDYVFFSHYPELKQVPSSSGVFLYANPGKPLRGYDQIIVNPAGIHLQPGSDYSLAPAKSQELADFFREEIIASLSDSYRVVSTPAQGVLRVSVALADIRHRQPASGDSSPDTPEYQPVLVLLIRDSTTGEAIVLLRDLNRGNEFAALAGSDDVAVRTLLSDWARTLRARLDETQRAADQQDVAQP